MDSVDDLRAKPWAGRRLDVVLLDVPGVSSRDEVRMEQLREMLHASSDRIAVDTFLVLAANLGEDTLRHVERSYSRLQLTGTVITKIDETRRPGPVLESVWRKEWPVGFLSDSPDLEQPLFRPSGSMLGDLLLQGKLR